MHDIFAASKYEELKKLTDLGNEISLGDHLNGFTKDKKNYLLTHLHDIAQTDVTVYHDQVFSQKVRDNYPKFSFKLNLPLWLWNSFKSYNIHPEINYKQFVCSFNGSAHISRQLLVAALNQFEFFNPTTCSKNFSVTEDVISGHIKTYSENQERFYNKFFISLKNIKFLNEIHSFGLEQYNHSANIFTLEKPLTSSFVHVVSETMATSYVPFITEKFLYSIVTRGLFVTYGQPGWHDHLEKFYGFKKYDKIFNYGFDQIENPVERLVELLSMLSKFKNLSVDDWVDLYLLEQDTVEYNYQHYFTLGYRKTLDCFN